MNTKSLLEEIQYSSMLRLRWRVLRYMGIAYGTKIEKEISDKDCLIAAANILLDRKIIETKTKDGDNPSFDFNRFMYLKGGNK